MHILFKMQLLVLYVFFTMHSLNCVELQVGEWGLSLGLDCQACACNQTGSLSAECDQDTGVCSCKPGVSGRACNECAAGHYGFSSSGCRGAYDHVTMRR